jgi:hypothetical protein
MPAHIAPFVRTCERTFPGGAAFTGPANWNGTLIVSPIALSKTR